jgi:filamentous hemagglutinin family protein
MIICPMTHGLVFQETSGSNKKLPFKLVGWIAAGLWFGLSGIAQGQVALPQGGSVASGAVIIIPTDSSTLTIDQSSATAIMNWDSFSIGTGGHVNIIQSSANSVILNRVTGDTISAIHGRLTATGQVHLVNPNGIFIGPNGSVDAGSFAASTLDISDEDFNAGRLRYSGNGDSATVENAGRITIGRGGYAALIGGRVRNSGIVVVPMGRIGFAAGELVTLDVSGDQFLQVALPSDSDDDGQALIENSGVVRAEGGLIEMRAATARNAARHAINMSGVAEASSVSVQGGTITLGGGAGGRVTVSGRVLTRAAPRRPRLDTTVVTSARPMARGGQVTITGNQIALNGAQIDASGDAGGGLIRIGGDFAGAGPLQRASYVGVDAQTLITADALNNGAGGRIAVWSDLSTEFAGTLSARGGDAGGDGGFIEISSRLTLSYSGSADLRAPLGLWGTLLLDPADITINPGAGGESGLEADLLANALTTGNVILDTTNVSASDAGDITINADVDWAVDTTLTLLADNDIIVNGDLTAALGSISLTATNDIALNGAINVDDLFIAGNDITTGAGGTVDVNLFQLDSGNWSQVASILPDFDATNFRLGFSSSFLRATGGDGTVAAPYLLNDVFGLQGLNSDTLRSSQFQLADDIQAAGTSSWVARFGSDGAGFQSIDSFEGRLDGDGFAILDLFQDGETGESANSVGLFSSIGVNGIVENLDILDANLLGGGGGILVNNNAGTISGVAVSGVISGDGFRVGGLVGTNTGLIQDSISEGSVIATVVDSAFGGHHIGGFVGRNEGTIERSHSVALVSVVNTNPASTLNVGGFVGTVAAPDSGSLGGVVNDSYARGNVNFTSNQGSDVIANLGGFAGLIENEINRSFSTGSTANTGDANAFTGGFAAVDGSGSSLTSTNFWDTVTSGATTSVRATALTTAQFQDTAGFFTRAGLLGWDFANDWAPGGAGEYPVNYSTSPVVFVIPESFSGTQLTLQYGLTQTASTPGTVSGGPLNYVFDDDGDILNTATALSNLSFANGQIVGTTTFSLGVTNLASVDGVGYRVIALDGNAEITPAALTITANDATKVEGDELIFSSTEITVDGLLLSDTVTSAVLTSDGAPADALAADSPFDITIESGSVVGEGLANYNIAVVDGILTVEDALAVVVPTPQIPIPPVFVGFPLPNPSDTFDDGGLGTSTGVIGGFSGGGSVVEAENTLTVVEDLAAKLEAGTNSCGQSSGDTSRYLACLSDSLDEFASELDSIAVNLPPGMRNVASIVQDARVKIDQARTRAQSRLANAGSDAERQVIRRDAVNEARAALNTASNETRKAISLVRADDPELASVQRATVIAVSNAIDSVGIKLSRAVDL